MARQRILVTLSVATLISITLITVILRQEKHYGIFQSNIFRPRNSAENQNDAFSMSSAITRSPTSKAITNNVIKHSNDSLYILLWTSFFGANDYLPSTDEMQCQERRCIITSDRQHLSKSAAVVFHFLDAMPSDLPKFRLPNQRWIVFTIESPQHSDLSFFDHLVNWTATYRLDSDLVTPYGHVRKLTPSEEVTKAGLNKNYAASKTKMVAWFVSNCHTPSNRENFVRDLQKVIPVDIYGQCGTFSCLPKMSKECYSNVSEKYRFYLSFENSLCKDYVTEKFFHALQSDIIPVVFGDANYSRIAPPNSFIDALSFHSPEDLGKFLLKLSSDDARYNSYFEWKKHYTFGGYHWVCAMCQKLHEPIQKPSIYHDLKDWWIDKSHCWSWTRKK